MTKRCREYDVIEWLSSVVETRQWPGRLGERLGDASAETAVSISSNVAARGDIGSVNESGDWG